ncbi:hypothetical protein BT69DRAFT_728925 [Atractiella rhizophila]|nr:hypothetical protein BT69DRAFT_728925 [Atractiella rhizophila]
MRTKNEIHRLRRKLEDAENNLRVVTEQLKHRKDPTSVAEDNEVDAAEPGTRIAARANELGTLSSISQTADDPIQDEIESYTQSGKRSNNSQLTDATRTKRQRVSVASSSSTSSVAPVIKEEETELPPPTRAPSTRTARPTKKGPNANPPPLKSILRKKAGRN